MQAPGIVREIRRRRRLSQRALAALGGVPPVVIARYETGRVQPTLERLRRLAESAGLELTVTLDERAPRAPRTHRLHDRRSLTYHRLVAEAARANPTILLRARERVELWLSGKRPFGGSAEYAQAWAELLRRPDGEVLQLITEDGERMAELRQSSPFNGLLGQRAWNRVVREVQPEAADALEVT